MSVSLKCEKMNFYMNNFIKIIFGIAIDTELYIRDDPSPAKLFHLFFTRFNPLSPHDALKHHFSSLNTDLIFLQKGFRIKIPMKLAYQYMAIVFNF